MYYTVLRLQLDGKDYGDLLEKFGFKEKFIGLIRQCISTMSFTLLINDNVSGRITPSKFLKEGDPISPYFNPKEVNKGSIRGVKNMTYYTPFAIHR
jgi:hypothetical protein